MSVLLESITIQLPAPTLAALRAEAEAQGKAPEEMAAGLLDAFYAPDAQDSGEGSEEERQDILAALTCSAHPFEPDALRRKYGLPINRSLEEITAAADTEVARLNPSARELAERQGLI